MENMELNMQSVPSYIVEEFLKDKQFVLTTHIATTPTLDYLRLSTVNEHTAIDMLYRLLGPCVAAGCIGNFIKDNYQVLEEALALYGKPFSEHLLYKHAAKVYLQYFPHIQDGIKLI